MRKLIQERILNLICGWCRKSFREIIRKDERGERNILSCPHCARTLPSSKIESTGSLTGRKHIHTEWKNGDVVT